MQGVYWEVSPGSYREGAREGDRQGGDANPVCIASWSLVEAARPPLTRDPLRNRPEQWEAGVCTPARCPPLMEGGSGGKGAPLSSPGTALQPMSKEGWGHEGQSPVASTMDAGGRATPVTKPHGNPARPNKGGTRLGQLRAIFF